LLLEKNIRRSINMSDAAAALRLGTDSASGIVPQGPFFIVFVSDLWYDAFNSFGTEVVFHVKPAGACPG
jgi:hypothetical protein